MAALPQMEVAHWVGSIRTIGQRGPMYEVLGPAGRSPEGDPLVSIRVISTGEVTDYEFEDMMKDPEAVYCLRPPSIEQCRTPGDII